MNKLEINPLAYLKIFIMKTLAIAIGFIIKIKRVAKGYSFSYFFCLVLLLSASIRTISYDFEYVELNDRGFELNHQQIYWGFLLLGAISSLSKDNQIDTIDDEKGKRVATYRRASTIDQVKDMTGYETQKDQLVEMEKKLAPVKVYTFEDPGKSGKEFNNRQIGKIIELARKRLIDEFWVTKIDRVGRNLLDLLFFFVILWRNDVVIRLPDDTYPADDLAKLIFIVILSFMAEAENELRSERLQAGLEKKFQKGFWVTSAPFGYIKNEKKLEKLEGYAQIIIDIFKMFIKGVSYKKISERINRRYNLTGKERLLPGRIKKGIILNTTFSGSPKYKGKTRTHSSDIELRYVSIEMQDCAISQPRAQIKEKDHFPEDIVVRYIQEDGEEAFRDGDICLVHSEHLPSKDHRLYFNGPRNGGEQQNLLCKICGRQFTWPKMTHLKAKNKPKVFIQDNPFPPQIYSKDNTSRAKKPVKKTRKAQKSYNRNLKEFFN